MSEEIPAQSQQIAHGGILDKTFGEILQNNPQAQNIVMKAMNISPEQLQQMLQKTGEHELMHMTIREMFQNGVMEQAMQQQFLQSTGEQATEKEIKKQSLIEKLKRWF